MDEKESTRELVVVDVKRYKKVKDALKESEERFRHLFENVPLGIYRTTPDGRIVDSNPALVRMLGYGSFAELATRNLEKDFSDAGYKRADFKKALERHGEIIGLESVWTKKDGGRIHVRENAKLIRGPGDEVFFEGTVEDITLGKEAEAAQRLRTQQLEIINCIIALGNASDTIEELLDSILDHVLKPLEFKMTGIFLYDAEAREARVMAYRGVPKSFFSSKKYMSVATMPFSQVLLHGRPVFADNAREVIPDLARKWKWTTAGCVPMISKGRVVGAISVANCERLAFSPEEKDILELIGKEAGTLISKLQTETALRESEKYYRTLIDTSPDIIFVLDFKGTLAMVNQRFLQIGGYFYDEVVGHSVLEFVQGVDPASFQKGISQFKRTGKIGQMEYPVRKKDGSFFPLELALTMLTDEKGRPSGMMGIGRDISDRKLSQEALHESEEKFRSIAEQTSDLIAITDARGVITYASPSSQVIFRCEPEAMRGRNFTEFLAADSVPRALAAFHEALERGERTVDLELNMKRSDGSLFIGELNGSNFRFRDQFGTLVVIRDISQRKRDEAQLRFLGSVTENTSDAIIVTDTDFQVTYINKVAEEFFGYGLDELKGKTPQIFNAEPEAAEIQQALYRKVAAGNVHLGESLNRRKDGSTFFCEYKVMPLKDADGRIYAYSSVQRDISERKRNEEVLRRSEDTFRRTFEAIPDPAYVWNMENDGRLLLGRFNQAAEQITRGKISEFVGVEAETLFADNPELAASIRLAMETGRRQSAEMLYNYKSTGESKWLQVDYVKTAEKSVMVITKDISERKEAEARLLAYQEQLRALTSEMVLVEERERRRIAAELHDQIGQNLALCKMKVTALENSPLNETLKNELNAVRRLLECSIQDARSLIFDLSPPVLYELGFTAALEWLAERMQAQFQIPIEFDGRSRDPELPDDRQVILFQVVRELLINVGKHSQATRAKLILSREGPLLKVQVNDDGVGFDAAKVFAPRQESDGFGFFSIRERLNYVGGKIEVRSRPGQGSQVTLTVTLPAQSVGRRPLEGLPKNGAAAGNKENS